MWKTILPSPVGELCAFATDTAVCGLLWQHSNEPGPDAGAKWIEPDSHPVLALLRLQLDEFFSGTRQDFDLSLAPMGSPFQLAVWNALTTIPFGETRSYSQQAELIGKPAAARAVGAAIGKNPISIIIPCHRVIGKNGDLTGFAGGIPVKRFLLNHERQHRLSLRAMTERIAGRCLRM